MKKFIFFLLFMLMVNPVFAGNILQQQDELKFVQKVAKTPLPTHYGKDYLIREDYYGYWNGKDALYGVVVNTLEDISKSNISNKELNIKYLDLLKNKVEIIVSLQNNSIDGNMRKNAASKKIIIDDEDYKKLSERTKEIITIYNYFFFD